MELSGKFSKAGKLREFHRRWNSFVTCVSVIDTGGCVSGFNFFVGGILSSGKLASL